MKITRRKLFKGIATLGTLTPFLGRNAGFATNITADHKLASSKAERAYQARAKAALIQKRLGAGRQQSNGDEHRLQHGIACYCKGLPHNDLGEADIISYGAYIKALESADHYQLERIPLGGYAKLANPQASFALDLLGPDSSQISIPPAPSFSSAEQASEMVELYWKALLRDIPLTNYPGHPLCDLAAKDLSQLSDFRGPNKGKVVSAKLLFRGAGAGCLVGPYISQFLWRDIPLSPIRAPQKIRTVVPEVDYNVEYEKWLSIQNGYLAGINEFDPIPRYIRTGRDLAEYVHRDFTYQAFICAALMLFNMGAPSDGGNPYRYSHTQSGFVTFGQSYVFRMLADATDTALKATWYQKWLVHRRIRPEEFGGRVHNHLNRKAEYPLHADLLNSKCMNLIREKTGGFLLPMVYPEGCPLHPSYPAGHAVIAGACATILKACFDESFSVPNPVITDENGLTLNPFGGPSLTIGGELDKLAWNIALARDFAGVHWRSDSAEGIKLGEQIAIYLLKESKLTENEIFNGFSLVQFDGARVTI